MYWTWLVMGLSFAYAGLVVYAFAIELSERIRMGMQGVRQPFARSSRFNIPPPEWWVRLCFIIAGYAFVIFITWLAHMLSRKYGWDVATHATVFSASLSAIFIPPTFLMRR